MPSFPRCFFHLPGETNKEQLTSLTLHMLNSAECDGLFQAPHHASPLACVKSNKEPNSNLTRALPPYSKNQQPNKQTNTQKNKKQTTKHTLTHMLSKTQNGLPLTGNSHPTKRISGPGMAICSRGAVAGLDRLSNRLAQAVGQKNRFPKKELVVFLGGMTCLEVFGSPGQ